MSIIEASGISWRYEDDEPDVFNSLDLTVHAGEFIGIMGPTGSGKTSLALTLRGIIPSFQEEGNFSGQVIVNGINVSESDAQYTAGDIGLVFQDAGSQIIGTRVIQDATLGPSNLGLERDVVFARARKYLSRVKLGGLEERPSSDLSGGQMQRLAIAGVLAVEPKVLILDEPVAELDPVGRREVAEILVELKEHDGATVILIEQDPELVAKFCDRVILLSHGRIVKEGTPREVFSNPAECIEYGVFAPEAAVLAQEIFGKNESIKDIPLTADELLECIEVSDAALEPLAKEKEYNSEREGKTEAIALKGVDFSYEDGNQILGAIDLSINKGEYVALVGSNGAGKTTLTKLLNGLRRPQKGAVYINGRDIANTSTSQIALDVGYCFQNPDHQIFSSSTLSEVMFGLECRGIEGDDATKQAERVLEQFGLKELANENPNSLGKGERQKIALASVLVLNPPIVVIDEPTTGLDWTEAQEILNLIDEINRNGSTVLAVTHDMRLVRDRASRVLAMSAGNIIFDGRPVDFFLDKESMQKADVEPPVFSEILSHLRKKRAISPDLLPADFHDLARLLIHTRRKFEKENV